jgi:hypothetical protein
MNVKELVDTVTVVTPLEIRGRGVLTEWVSKSDFDRVVKILVDSMNIYKVDAIKYAEELGREFADSMRKQSNT